MDPVIIFGSVLGLLIGSLGYVLYIAAVRPVLTYRRIKGRIQRLMPDGRPPDTGPDARRTALELAERLRTCYENQLPIWYQQLLVRRKEIPVDAIAGLQKLATTKHTGGAASLAASVRQALNL